MVKQNTESLLDYYGFTASEQKKYPVVSRILRKLTPERIKKNGFSLFGSILLLFLFFTVFSASAANPDGATTVYTYDASGERIKTVTTYPDGTTETITCPFKNYCVNDKGEATKYITLPSGDLIATIKGTGALAKTYYVATDHLTGSNIVTNSSGALEELMDYYPYGSTRFDEKSSSFDEKRKFAGYEYDESTDLNYAGARYYNAGIGKFISQDPLIVNSPEKVLADPQSLNYYTYSRNNPLRFIDPTGLYNIETGQVEKGDTPDIIVGSINKAFGINTNWITVRDVSFYSDRFQNKILDQIVGQSLHIGTSITTDVTRQLNGLNQSRSTTAQLFGKGSLGLFAPNGPWDIKNSKDPILGGGTNRQYKSYIYNGELIRYDAPGNINYGYVASSLNLPGFVIQGGAKIQQVADDRLHGQKATWKDNSGDSGYIQKGIDTYKSQLLWWKRIFNW